MNLVVDESVDKRIVDALRQVGHNVLNVAFYLSLACLTINVRAPVQ